MRAEVRLAATIVGAAAPLAFACTGGPALTGAGALPDAAVDAARPGVPFVTIHTSTPSSELGPAAPASATWAAFRREDGTWALLAESAVGSATYAFQTSDSRWAAVFACADDQSSLVTLEEGSVSGQAAAEVVLDRFCGRAGPNAVTLSGTLAHLSQGTNWLDFGYPLEARGAVLPSAGASASYEEVNLVAGTWDLSFGTRPSPGDAFSRIAILRGRTLAADTSLDVDLAGPSAVAAGKETLRITGLDPTHESIAAPVYYATNGGVRGLDLGPQNIPTSGSLALAYATLPAAIEEPGDRYRAEVKASANDDSATRGVLVELETAQAVELSLPEPLAVPAISVVATTPYPRLRAVVQERPDAAKYALEATAQVSNRSSRTWRVRVAEPPPGDVTLETPDVSSVAGFDASWALPAAQGRVVTVTSTARLVQVAGGTQEPWAAHVTSLSP